MKNTLRKVALICAASLMLVGCGGSNDKKVDAKSTKTEINPSELAKSLIDGITFEGTLKENSQEDIDFNFDELAKEGSVMYLCADTYEEVAVLVAENEDATAKLKESVDTYLSYQKDDADKYKPEGSKRIEDAVIITSGKYVILCVSDDSDGAKKIIDKAFE